MSCLPAAGCTEGNDRDEKLRSTMYLSAYIFSFAREPGRHVRPDRQRDQRARRTTDECLAPLTPRTGRPASIPNKRAYTRFSERTGDNADKSAVPRKKFHSTGMVLASEETPARPAKRADRPGPPERTGIVGWHGYCTEHVIRGDRSEFSSGFSGWDLPGSPVTTSSGK